MESKDPRESKAVTVKPAQDKAAALESVLIQGDLSKLTTEERTRYYMEVCESLGVNHLTRPFEYIVLNSKLTLYAKRDCTDQLRNLRNVSIEIVSRDKAGEIYAVTARARLANGRTDESMGAVNVGRLSGEALANAFMKAETKAKRRVTLSICGLGVLDEIEVEAIAPPPQAIPKAPVKRMEDLLTPAPKAIEQPADTSLAKARATLSEKAKLYGWKNGDLKTLSEFTYGVTASENLTEDEIEGLITLMAEKPKLKAAVFEENIDGARD